MKIILFYDSFDPVSNYEITAIKESIEIIQNDLTIFIPTYFDLLNNKYFASIEQRINMCKIIANNIYNHKFIVSDYGIQNKNYTNFYDLIEFITNKFGIENEYFLLISNENLKNFSEILNSSKIKFMVNIICYFKKDKEIVNSSFFQKYPIIYLKKNSENYDEKNLIFDPRKEYFDQDVLNYINNYGIYAKSRLKVILSNLRYEHSLRVANTALKISKIIIENNFNNYLFKHKEKDLIRKSFVAGIYHDIAKEFSRNKQVEIAKNKLKISSWPSWKVLHGPVGAWYLKNHYLLDDPEILQAIAEHTLPLSLETNLLSQIIFMADHLEPNRLLEKNFSKEKYDYFWNLIKNNEFQKAFKELYDFLVNLHPKSELSFQYPIKF